MADSMKYACPCCGFLTFTTEPPGTFDTCPVCYWEDDHFQFEDPGYAGGANDVSLEEARRNFREIGAITERASQFVRLPRPDEIPSVSNIANHQGDITAQVSQSTINSPSIVSSKTTNMKTISLNVQPTQLPLTEPIFLTTVQRYVAEIISGEGFSRLVNSGEVIIDWYYDAPVSDNVSVIVKFNTLEAVDLLNRLQIGFRKRKYQVSVDLGY